MPSEEYLRLIDDLYGVYLDAMAAFEQFKKFTEQVQCELMRKLPGMTIEKLDRKLFSYGYGGDPGDPSYVELHQTRQGGLKRRLSEGGRDRVYVGNMLIVNIYQHWEDKYRSEIGRQFGKKKNDLTSDVFGDLRRIRKSIIHHGSVALPELEHNRVLKQFSPGDPVVFNEKEIEEIITIIREEMVTIRDQHETPRGRHLGGR